MDTKLRYILNTFISAYNKLDKDIVIHCKEVAFLTLSICDALSLDKDTKKDLIVSAYLHDISASKTNFLDTL
ncbi:hypothetical protein [uncultured Clostridium sp.]|nr:hypothetical protein [uncultured Clostridium sp.]